MRHRLFVWTVIALLCMTTALAQTETTPVSLQLKRTNPGIPDIQSSELIFDVVNTDFTHEIEGFLLCMSPDDATISSTYGAGSGSGAQYVSPKFFMDVGPSQEAMTITVDSSSQGDKDAGCMLKYIQYKMETVEDTGLGTTEQKLYYVDGAYTTTPEDADYTVETLDKTLPFVTGFEKPTCPSGTLHCMVSDVIEGAIKDMGGDSGDFPVGLIAGIIIIVVVLIILKMVFKTGKRAAPSKKPQPPEEG